MLGMNNSDNPYIMVPTLDCFKPTASLTAELDAVSEPSEHTCPAILGSMSLVGILHRLRFSEPSNHKPRQSLGGGGEGEEGRGRRGGCASKPLELNVKRHIH